ncbi:hypothetical protein GALMADRAFT_212339 [Galerina marginata CBS 339.88]|uniref:NADP-dependent oxidoreductase domain-containing protein n=1 Tax=Galerina marginata (strain CBS 339.88) TaxID=685588 RepID=A0A067SRD3_GALM3|nr:hypothetical protein GALMADRAFT_212339 [Galerina marginata CBS 339.88]
MASTQKSALNIVMGAMTFGESGKEGARVHDVKDAEAILDAFKAHGHTEIDSARTYAGGTSEEYLGKIDLLSKGFKIETKLAPRKNVAEPISHDAEVLIFLLSPHPGIEKELAQVFKGSERRVRDSLEMWYLHAPDHTVPYEITLKVVNDLHKEGYFKRFGISNYPAYEVAEIVGICKANGYIQPTAYQGIYNAVHRAVEPELLPCLRKFGISFYEFNPLGGGFFTGRYNSLDNAAEEGSRFDPNRNQGQNYRRSLLKREYGDAIIIGASSLKHIEENLVDLEKGPLPEEVVKVLDEAWFDVQRYASCYFK